MTLFVTDEEQEQEEQELGILGVGCEYDAAQEVDDMNLKWQLTITVEFF